MHNTEVFFKVLLLITYGTEGTFTSVFKNKRSLSSHKTVEMKVFLNIFLPMEGSVQIITDSGGIREAQNLQNRNNDLSKGTGTGTVHKIR